MYKLAIFDLDGTILNTIEDLANAGNVVLQRHNYPLHSIDEYKYFVGNGIPKLVERMLPADTSKENHALILKEYLEYYGANCAVKTAPYKGIVDCVKKIRQMGVIAAVNTNKVESAAVELCNDYFPDCFDIICGNRPGVPVKPAPDGVYEILKRAGMSLETAQSENGAVFIGDSDVDIQTGHNAGIAAIGVDWGFRGKAFLLAHGAATVVMNPEELYAQITK